ncbi:hypothetical protein LINPERPRIM_LOCUS23711, partial [Linum perenne]
SEEAAALLEKIDEKLEKEGDSINEHGEGEDGPFAPLEGDILYEVLGPEKNGRVRGMGFGVNPKMFTKSNLDVIREKEQANEHNQKLEEQVGTLNDKINKLGEFIFKFIGSANPQILQQTPNIETLLNVGSPTTNHASTSSSGGMET